MDLKTLWTKLTRPTTEAERKMRMKYLVAFPAMFLTTGIILWIIFDSFGTNTEANANGFNQNMPEPDAQEITADKRDAYASVKDTIPAATETLPLMDSVPNVKEEVPQPSAIETSNQTYADIQASLDEFYIPEDNSAAQVAELQAKIDELEAQNAQVQQAAQPDEMALLERSYQLAAQYMGGGNGGGQAVIVEQPTKERKVQPVNQVTHTVVSSLGASSERSFSTAVGGKRQAQYKNTISACVAADQSVMDGQSVRLRTLEPMWIGNSFLPKNTAIVGSARLQG